MDIFEKTSDLAPDSRNQNKSYELSFHFHSISIVKNLQNFIKTNVANSIECLIWDNITKPCVKQEQASWINSIDLPLNHHKK